MLVEQEARIIREAGLFGGLMYVGAAAAAGAIVVSGGTLAAGITAAVLAGGAGVPHRLSPGQMDRRSTCALSARADGSWRLAVVGADLGCRERKARRRNSQKAFGRRRPCPRTSGGLAARMSGAEDRGL